MFLSEKEYRHAVDLMSGREPKSRLLEELGEWFQITFHQTVYDYICDRTNQGRLRLRIFLWDQKEKKKMMKGLNLDERKQKKIHVFFETEEQMRDHQEDGTYERIDQKMTAIVRSADKMGVFQDGVKCIFSSRQTLDEKYHGSMFY